MTADSDDVWPFFCEDLLLQIEAGDVVPIIGSELVECAFGDHTRSVDEWLAEQLVEQFRVPRGELPDVLALNDVGAWMNRNRPRDYPALYARVHALIEQLPAEPPDVLRELAAIRDFGLYVTTTIDPLLDRALRDPRAARSEVLAPIGFTATGSAGAWYGELPRGSAFVYHLLGRTSNRPTFVLSDEDKLEWLLAMHRHATEPVQLLDVLSRKHLLFLGTDFPDWLARLILRTTKRTRLSLTRAEGEILAGRTVRDGPLTGFLSAFSVTTRVYPGSPREFVRQIHARWIERNGAKPAPTHTPFGTPIPAPRLTPNGARDHVFISYRRGEDSDVATQVREVLESNNVDVWIDVRDIPGGGDWNREIEAAIRECILFLPVITPGALSEDESYLRREWRLAAERVKSMSEGRPFIVPVFRGEIPSPQLADVPDAFKAKQWTPYRDASDRDRLVSEVVNAVRAVRSRRVPPPPADALTAAG